MISLDVPVYKEESNIRPILERAERVFADMGAAYEIIFALDPSPDRTAEVIKTEIDRNPRIRLMLFSRRFGQPAATIAGILAARGDYCAVIDVDLQDPPELIAAMYSKALEGFDVVYAQRRTRAGETWLKRVISHVGYTLINKLSEIEIPRNTGDFRLMSRRVIEELRGLNETMVSCAAL